MAKWHVENKSRFEEHCLLAAIAAGFPLEEARLADVKAKGFVERRTTFSITERGRQRLEEVAGEIKKVSRELDQ